MDVYIKERLEAIKKAKTDDEIADILDEIYNDAFEDGANYSEAD